MKKLLVLLLIGASLTSCRKNKIEKNLNGEWSVTSMVEDGYNNVDNDLAINLEFKNIDKGEGDLVLSWIEFGDVFLYYGTVSLNDEYTVLKADITLAGGFKWIWDTNLTVDKSSLFLAGTETYHTSASGSFSLNATKK